VSEGVAFDSRQVLQAANTVNVFKTLARFWEGTMTYAKLARRVLTLLVTLLSLAGGSALAQVFRQIGSAVPDVEDAQLLKAFFDACQAVRQSDPGLVLAYHDRSDGGLFTTVAEMAFAGRVGVEINLDTLDCRDSSIEALCPRSWVAWCALFCSAKSPALILSQRISKNYSKNWPPLRRPEPNLILCKH